MSSHRSESRPSPVSRRTFLQLTVGALAAWLAGCSPSSAPPTAMPSPVSQASSASGSSLKPAASPTHPLPSPGRLPPTYTLVRATPTSPPRPSPTVGPAAALSRAALLAHWPATPTSRVVIVRHSGVWKGNTPDPAIVLQMLDAGLSTLTDVSDVKAVWRALFDPDDRVLLKVNCIAAGGPTQPAVAYAVAQRLQDAARLPVENILIFDRTDYELEAAGYTLNEKGSGVRCHGSRGAGAEIALTQARVRFYQELDACTALVNLPTPKQHGTSGVSCALKNHYGSVDRPGALHGNRCDPAIAELNAQPLVRDKTRLIVGAALRVSPFDWNRPAREDALLFSFDPVALDTVGRDILVRHWQARGQDVGLLVNGVRHLSTAQTMGLGATDAGRIDLREVTLE